VLKQIYDVPSDTASLARCTPAVLRKGAEWQKIINSAKYDKMQLCNFLQGKRLYSTLHGMYAIALS
jgi:hypothetical protein